MPFLTHDGMKVFAFQHLLGQPVVHGVISRHGGVSAAPYQTMNVGGTVGDAPEAVLENLKRSFAFFGRDLASRFDVWQVHGSDVVCTDRPRKMKAPFYKADGIITNKPEVTLFMRFADCVPIVFFDPRHQVIALAHAGWQGTLKKVVKEVVRAMHEHYNSQPADILAGIGPSICAACYQVGDAVEQATRLAFGEQSEAIIQFRQGKPHLDLWQANRLALAEAGVTQVETAEICTACEVQDWYSHRAEQGRTGRFGMLLALAGDA